MSVPVATLMSVLCLTPTLPFTPQDASIRAISERYSVEALDPGGGDRPARILVSDKVTSRRHMVMVNSTLGELRRAVIRDDQERVTLVCAKGFAVIDPTGRSNTDEVYGLDAVVSPDGRWIAHRRFYPPTHPGPTDGIVVYDTRQAADKNHAAYPIGAEREWRAGWAIYPPADSWKDANAVHGGTEAQALSSPIAWEGARTAPALLFSMRRGDRDVMVLTDFAGGTPRTCWSALPGPADRWRVKTLTYRRGGNSHTVTVASSAVTDPAKTTVPFAEDCTGAVP